MIENTGHKQCQLLLSSLPPLTPPPVFIGVRRARAVAHNSLWLQRASAAPGLIPGYETDLSCSHGRQKREDVRVKTSGHCNHAHTTIAMRTAISTGAKCTTASRRQTLSPEDRHGNPSPRLHFESLDNALYVMLRVVQLSRFTFSAGGKKVAEHHVSPRVSVKLSSSVIYYSLKKNSPV